MSCFVLDTSCMIAAISGWHEHHEVTIGEIESSLHHNDQLLIAAPALIESFAVLTRLPSPHRLSPATAATLLETNFRSDDAVMVSGEEYWALILSAPDRGIAGGVVYDAVILACAIAAEADNQITRRSDIEETPWPTGKKQIS
jgi:toxin FitB